MLWLVVVLLQGEVGLVMIIICHTHTLTGTHIHSQSSLRLCTFPSVSGVQKAAGLIKWKWPIITKAMTGAVGRYHTLAYLRAVMCCTAVLCSFLLITHIVAT